MGLIFDLRTVRGWLSAGLLCSVLVALCYLFIDRPVATFVHAHLSRPVPLASAGRATDLLLPLVCLTLIVTALRRILGTASRRGETLIFQSSLAFVLVSTIKSELKILFSRSWPETWINDNPSFITDGVYGFHWLQGGDAYASFPSGHMATSCALLTVLSLRWPAYRWLWIGLAATMATALIAANAHFVGDVIAGAFLGGGVGYACAAPAMRQS